MQLLSYIASILISVFYLLIAGLYIALFYTEKQVYHRVARILIFVALAVHLSFIVYSGITEGRIPLTTTFKAISFLTLIITCIYIATEYRTRAESLGAFVFPLISIFHIISMFGLGIVPIELDILKTPLFGFHIISAVIGYSAFAYSMVLGVMYLYLFSSIKKKKLKAAYDRLPPLEKLEKMNSVSQIGGLVFLTLAIVTGARMATIEWKGIPIFDPKIFLTGLLFLVYLVNVISKFLLKLGGRKMAYMALLGFCLLLCVFVGANFVLPTLHRF